ncbi:YheC/YheD family protein [Paenibacillus sp. TRM 82003]|nr:YheC/YheD family protein [Paenibacillus sp. TRM 82003]
MGYSKTKWSKYKLLRRSSELASLLPATQTLRRSRLRNFLEKYGEVIVKPTGGWGGAGVMAISALGRDQYGIQYGKKRATIEGLRSTYAYIRAKTRGREYILQRKISLATVNGRPFDLRIMVQRRRGGDWKVTGKLAKIAGSGYIVTNVARSGGRVVSLQAAVRDSNIAFAARNGLEERLDRVALTAAERLQPHYRGIRTVGLDVGVDAAGRIWIIEANFTPAVSLFAKLEDRTMYRRIRSYR